MRKILIAAALGASTLLTACGSGGGLFNRDRPDEFAVTRQAPLVIPPDFGLVPPAPGAPTNSGATVGQQALDAMFGGAAPRSPAETSALTSAGRNMASVGIRSNVGDPDTAVSDKGLVTRDIIAAPEGDGQYARATAGM